MVLLPVCLIPFNDDFLYYHHQLPLDSRDIQMRDPEIGDEFFPGIDKENDEEILEVIQNSLQTSWHTACAFACAIRTTDNPVAVLDSEARVYGIQSLRVVDARSLPFIQPGDP
jgi:choline dehydrogenase-like flavoprotein